MEIKQFIIYWWTVQEINQKRNKNFFETKLKQQNLWDTNGSSLTREIYSSKCLHLKKTEIEQLNGLRTQPKKLEKQKQTKN